MPSAPDLHGIGVQPGDVLAGKYRVERIIGHGGMGVVVAAQHLVLDERVAIKLLLPEALGNSEAVARFVREAKAAVRIRSEHVARVSDVGYLDSGAPYIVMEHLEGVDLSAWLKQSGPLPVEQAVDFVLQASEAIADAHALGIVHRDLKPANLFWTHRSDGLPCIKVLDFGISKVIAPGSASDMTRTHAIIGSPFYMSPEQMHASRNVDVRTDIWSLGVILFELLARRPPFGGESISELAINVATVPSPPIRALRPDVPPGLELAIATSLEKPRERRFQTIADFAIALGDFGSPAARASVDRIVGTLRKAGFSTTPPPMTSSAPATSGPLGLGPSTASSWGQTRGPGARRATFVWAGAITAVVLLAGGLLAVRMLPARAVIVPADTTPSVEPAAPAPSILPLSPLVVASASPSASSPPAASTGVPPGPAPRPAPTGRKGNAGPPSPVLPAPTPAPTAAPNGACSPPYYFDADGHKQYKPECM
jgi:eukaryotic-like serine/threonine-protein kinase